MKLKEVERFCILNFIVIEPGLINLKPILSEEELLKYQDEFGEESFSAELARGNIRNSKINRFSRRRKNLVKTINRLSLKFVKKDQLKD